MISESDNKCACCNVNIEDEMIFDVHKDYITDEYVYLCEPCSNFGFVLFFGKVKENAIT